MPKVSAKLRPGLIDGEGRRIGTLSIDGTDFVGPIPPSDFRLREIYDAWIESGGQPVDDLPPVQEPRKPAYSKAQLFTAMNDEEYDLYEFISLSQPPRERGIFEMTTAIQPDHPLSKKFEQLVLQAYGKDRGKVLLEAATIPE